MNRRARRVTIAAAVIGTAVIAALVVANWGVIWHFQLTRATEAIEPEPSFAP